MGTQAGAFCSPKWTPAREDFCLAIAGEIEPEGTTLAERAEMKAERLDAIATNKTRKANAFTATADSLSRAFRVRPADPCGASF